MTPQEMSIEAIERRLGEVTEEIALIKAQIAEAKGIAAETGDYSDSDWFHRANLALRFKGREHQALQLEFGKRRKEERRQRNDTFERAFIDAARDLLDADTYKMVMAAAVARSS